MCLSVRCTLTDLATALARVDENAAGEVGTPGELVPTYVLLHAHVGTGVPVQHGTPHTPHIGMHRPSHTHAHARPQETGEFWTKNILYIEGSINMASYTQALSLSLSQT